MMLEQSKHPLANWIPYKLIEREDGVYFEWIYLDEIQYKDPFFDETISKCKSHPYYSSLYKVVSSVDCVLEWSHTIDTLTLKAFIFHVSRCGSTMISQLLTIPEVNVVISEAPVFDQIIRSVRLGSYEKEAVLKAAIKLLGQKRNDTQAHLIIKLDSWHLLKISQLRSQFPILPFFTLYRNPVEVLQSHNQLSGMHMVPYVLSPSTFDFKNEELESFSFEEYRVRVLEKYLNAIINFRQHDQQIVIFNYEDGMQSMLNTFTEFIKVNYTFEEKSKMSERLKTHSKHPSSIFTGDKVGDIKIETESIDKLYKQLQKENAL